MGSEGEKTKENVIIESNNSNEDFSSNELKLLNLLAEIIVNASIREYYEKSD